MFKLSIPKPCFEGWENMLPNEQGRYCNSCAKTVVDFSVMSDEAVQQYFIAHYDQKICGRFKNTQLQRIIIELPQNIFRIQLPFWKRFLVAFLICFGGSFLAIDTTMAGVNYEQRESIASYKKAKEIKADKKKPGHGRKKKHKRSIKYRSLSNIDLSKFPIMTLGYAPMHHEPPPVFPFDSTNYDSLKQHADTGNSRINIDTAPGGRKENPFPTTPDPATVFILPAVLASRNPFSKKKKHAIL